MDIRYVYVIGGVAVFISIILIFFLTWVLFLRKRPGPPIGQVKRRGGIVLGVIIFSIMLIPYAHAVDQSICNSASTITLHPSGTLSSCMLKDLYEANGIKCKSGPISFYDDGKLEGCVLAEKTTVGGVSCNESSPISFYPSGKLKSCIK